MLVGRSQTPVFTRRLRRLSATVVREAVLQRAVGDPFAFVIRTAMLTTSLEGIFRSMAAVVLAPIIMRRLKATLIHQTGVQCIARLV